MLKRIALIAGAATVLLVTEAAAQYTKFAQRPVGGRMCSAGSLDACVRCCARNNFGPICESRCRATYPAASAPRRASSRRGRGE